jgi:hypothetical protein
MIRLARTFICEFASANAKQRELENWQLGVADADDELTHVPGVLPAQRYGPLSIYEAGQIGGFRR